MTAELYCEILGFYLPLAMAVVGLIGLVGYCIDTITHKH